MITMSLDILSITELLQFRGFEFEFIFYVLSPGDSRPSEDVGARQKIAKWGFTANTIIKIIKMS